MAESKASTEQLVALAQTEKSMFYDAIYAASCRNDTKFFLQMHEDLNDQLVEIVLSDHNEHRRCWGLRGREAQRARPLL